jgi:site-specific DNA recombinase
LTVAEDKAVTIRRVFELRKNMPDAPLQKIADTLNAEGHTTKEGKLFYSMQIKRILDRRAFYEGTYRYSGDEAEGQHQNII